MNIDTLIKHFWEKYISYTPSAKKINQLFDEKITNDHIAFRTLNLTNTSIDVQKNYLEQFGYKQGGAYEFKVKKLKAIHLENEKVDLPKIFLSELLLEEFSYDLQKTFHEIFDNKSFVNDGLLMGGRKWEINYEKYIELSEESEYAAWLYVWGFCPNHFTISVNHLEGYQSLEEVNALIKKNGFKLNESGGEIKGSPDDLLEQSSIIADLCAVDFSGESHEVPSCYYEFAKRYEISEGEMYQGFIAKSADKIFESTNLQK